MGNYFLAIDQGTTSTRTVLYGSNFTALDQNQIEIRQYYPRPGYVEHDAQEIWDKTFSTVSSLLEKNGLDASQIISIGITNQRETIVGWDQKTGKPIGRAIVWQDKRTTDYCKTLKNQGVEKEVIEKTGLLLDPYFSASKLRWLNDNFKEEIVNKNILFGTIDTFLLWKLTKGDVYATDVSNAARTSLLNISTLEWDQDLIKLFELEKINLPEIKKNADDFGSTTLFGGDIKISGMAGDQQAALFGQTCFEAGDIKSTYGTGCFLILNTGNQILRSQNKLLTTIGYKIDQEVVYALEGSIFIAGALIQWLRDKMKFFISAPESEGLAKIANENSELIIVPSFTGLGAPFWNPDIKGSIHGISLDTTQQDIILASLEAIAFQSKDLIEAIKQDGAEINSIKIDGGMANNDFFVQILSDVLDVSVQRPKNIESTALGAAFFAGIGSGHVKFDELPDIWKRDKIFNSEKSYDAKYSSYLEALNASINK